MTGGGVWARCASEKNAVVPRGNPATTLPLKRVLREKGSGTQIDEELCKLVQIGAYSCILVQIDASWYRFDAG